MPYFPTSPRYRGSGERTADCFVAGGKTMKHAAFEDTSPQGKTALCKLHPFPRSEE